MAQGAGPESTVSPSLGSPSVNGGSPRDSGAPAVSAAADDRSLILARLQEEVRSRCAQKIESPMIQKTVAVAAAAAAALRAELGCTAGCQAGEAHGGGSDHSGWSSGGGGLPAGASNDQQLHFVCGDLY